MKLICEVSNRHVHLCAAHVEALFGEGHVLTRARGLSQPGQYLCRERIDLVGSKSTLYKVAIIGGVRGRSQVEVSRTDAVALGLRDVPVRQSGELAGSPGITIRNGERQVVLEEGMIVARRHIHLDPQTASDGGLVDGQIVSIEFEGERGGLYNNVIVRVGAAFAPAVHIDSDEAGAMGFVGGEVAVSP